MENGRHPPPVMVFLKFTNTCDSPLLAAPAVLAHRRGRQALTQQAGLKPQG